MSSTGDPAVSISSESRIVFVYLFGCTVPQWSKGTSLWREERDGQVVQAANMLALRLSSLSLSPGTVM